MMRIILKNILVITVIITYSYGMERKQCDIIKNCQNSCNVINSNSTNKIIDFYCNKELMSQYLQQKIITIHYNGSIQCNIDDITKFDWKLFSYNIKHSSSARANIQILLKEFSRNGTNLEPLREILYSYFDIKDQYNNNYIMENRTKELLCVIFYYYLSITENGNLNKLDKIQNNLNTIITYETSFNKIFTKYYETVYLPRCKRQNFRYSTLDGDIKQQSWNNVIDLVKKINLSKILKNIIVNINIGEVLFNREHLNTTDKIAEPLFISNGHNQCWFRSTLQLVNSAIEMCTKEMKDKLQSKPKYILVNFLKYLKNESAKVFDTNAESMLVKPKVTSFHKLFLYFNKQLHENVKQARNTEEIKTAEIILKYINENQIISNITLALPILAKLFPEIEYLFPEEQLSTGWEILKNNITKISNNNITKISNNNQITQYIFKEKNAILTKYYWPYNVCDDTSKMDFKPIPKEYCSKPYFFMLDDNDAAKTSLTEQIYTHQYRIGLDDNNNLIVYTLKGMHLSNPINTGDRHVWTYTALHNTINNWYFADSLNPYSNPAWKLTMVDIANFNVNSGIPTVIDTFMYRKINTNEIVNYINRA